MAAVLILVGSLVVLGLAVALFSRVGRDGGATETVAPAKGCAGCTGASERCEQECMMEAATKPIVYFDDEELDNYIGRPSDGYTDDEAEQFREILYTMQPNEVADWSRSLTLRGINVPNQLKDELLLLIKE